MRAMAEVVQVIANSATTTLPNLVALAMQSLTLEIAADIPPFGGNVSEVVAARSCNGQ
jgi:hypothetical protein